ncbi:anti-sigma factor [Mycolicibacillus parakoreensis]|uniref:ATP-binding protein n=1 Tax=Mycolicibacillus parakoreensis TaxID=1069221 RepID=A0ABY3U7F9_9MYCO|nr:ATP-binding protein [Mycolicibacillus parakoreensis]MCV7315535.1 anti-sigma factor [Mycolicibacillus parakoreensis]ULN54682.1 ATP-binding protein [Mycolicibacillus parakoreensis]
MEAAQDQRADRSVELRVAARVDNIAVVRTLVGAVGALEDFDVDSVADLRLAVDEACTQLVHAASDGATLVTVVDPGSDVVRIDVCVPCRGDREIVSPGSFGWHVLTSLVDEVDTYRDGEQPGVGGQTVGVVLTKRRVGIE